jgi:hypothetical protein
MCGRVFHGKAAKSRGKKGGRKILQQTGTGAIRTAGVAKGDFGTKLSTEVNDE